MKRRKYDRMHQGMRAVLGIAFDRERAVIRSYDLERPDLIATSLHYMYLILLLAETLARPDRHAVSRTLSEAAAVSPRLVEKVIWALEEGGAV